MPVVVSELVTRVSADTTSAEKSLQQYQRNLQGMTQGARRFGQSFGSSILGTVGKVAALGAGLGIAVGAIRGLGAAFTGVRSSAIGLNATLDTATLQFATLTGSTARAEEHVKSLFDFAKTTPFETGPIVEASRLLQVFGGDALNTADNLTLLGDAAAGTSAPFEDVSFWTGRLFSQLQAGRPFGEAAARLQELAIISPQARAQMEALQEAGASANEIFNIFRDDLGRFTGSMERMQTTWEGLTSTISDSLQLLTATAFRPFFDITRRGLLTLANLLGGAGVESAAERFASIMQNLLSGVEQMVINWVRAFSSMQSETARAVGRIAGFLSALAKTVTQFGVNIIGSLAQGMTQAIQLVLQALGVLARAIGGLLAPGSPPALLPNLDKWGTAAADSWLQGWTQANFEVIGEVGSTVERILRGRGGLEGAGLAEAVSGTREAIAGAIDIFRRTGDVGKAAYDRIRQAAGAAADETIGLVKRHVDLMRVTERVEGLQKSISELQSRRQDLQDQQRLMGIQERLSAGGLNAAERQQLLMEAQTIELEKRLRVAQKEQGETQNALDTFRARLSLQGESLSMTEQLRDAMEGVAGTAGNVGETLIGGIGDAVAKLGDIDFPELRPFELPSDIVADLERLREEFGEGFAEGELAFGSLAQRIEESVGDIMSQFDRLRLRITLTTGSIQRRLGNIWVSIFNRLPIPVREAVAKVSTTFVGLVSAAQRVWLGVRRRVNLIIAAFEKGGIPATIKEVVTQASIELGGLITTAIRVWLGVRRRISRIVDAFKKGGISTAVQEVINQVRELELPSVTAVIATFKAIIGTGVNIFTTIKDKVVEFVSSVSLPSFNMVISAIQAVVGAGVNIFNTIKEKVVEFVASVKLPSFNTVITAVKAVVGAGVNIFNTIKTKVAEFVSSITLPSFDMVISAVEAVIAVGISIFNTIKNKVLEFVDSVSLPSFDMIIDAIEAAVGLGVDIFDTIKAKVLEFVASVSLPSFNMVISAIEAVVGVGVSIYTTIRDKVIAFVSSVNLPSFNMVISAVKATVAVGANIYTTIKDKVIEFVSSVSLPSFNMIISAVKAIAGVGVNIFTTIKDKVVGFVSSVSLPSFNIIISAVKAIVGLGVNIFNTIKNKVVEFVGSVTLPSFSMIISAVSAVVGVGVSIFTTIKDKVAEFVSSVSLPSFDIAISAVTASVEAGVDILTIIKDKIVSFVTSINLPSLSTIVTDITPKVKEGIDILASIKDAIIEKVGAISLPNIEGVISSIKATAAEGLVILGDLASQVIANVGQLDLPNVSAIVSSVSAAAKEGLEIVGDIATAVIAEIGQIDLPSVEAIVSKVQALAAQGWEVIADLGASIIEEIGEIDLPNVSALVNTITTSVSATLTGFATLGSKIVTGIGSVDLLSLNTIVTSILASVAATLAIPVGLAASIISQLGSINLPSLSTVLEKVSVAISDTFTSPTGLGAKIVAGIGQLSLPSVGTIVDTISVAVKEGLTLVGDAAERVKESIGTVSLDDIDTVISAVGFTLKEGIDLAADALVAIQDKMTGVNLPSLSAIIDAIAFSFATTVDLAARALEKLKAGLISVTLPSLTTVIGAVVFTFAVGLNVATEALSKIKVAIGSLDLPSVSVVLEGIAFTIAEALGIGTKLLTKIKEKATGLNLPSVDITLNDIEAVLATTLDAGAKIATTVKDKATEITIDTVDVVISLIKPTVEELDITLPEDFSLSSALGWVEEIGTLATNFQTSMPNKLASAIRLIDWQVAGEALGTSLGNMIKGIVGIGAAFVALITGAFKGAVGDPEQKNAAAENLTTAVGDAVVGIGKGFYDGLAKSLIDPLLEAIGIKVTGITSINLVKEDLKTLLTDAKTNLLTELPDFGQIGKDAVDGIIQGFTDKGQDLKTFLTTWGTEHIPGPIKRLLGISSPATELVPIGEAVVEGISKGITGDKTLEKAIEGITKGIIAGLDFTKLARGVKQNAQKVLGAWSDLAELVVEALESSTELSEFWDDDLSRSFDDIVDLIEFDLDRAIDGLIRGFANTNREAGSLISNLRFGLISAFRDTANEIRLNFLGAFDNLAEQFGAFFTQMINWTQSLIDHLDMLQIEISEMIAAFEALGQIEVPTFTPPEETTPPTFPPGGPQPVGFSPAFAGAGTTINVTVNATISDDMDLERAGTRLARIINERLR